MPRAALVLILTAAPLAAAEPDRVDFVRDIQPIFAKHCYECHGAKQREGGLRLTNRRDAFTAADSGHAVIKAKDAAASLLLKRISAKDVDERMPPEEKTPLSAAQIALVKRWIDQGADWPADAAGEQHWAYVKPVRAAMPKVKAKTWPRNDIDYFILASMEQAGVSPSPPTDRARLIRRVSLALTGLPPTVAEVDAFVADKSPDAYERLVDRLIASPRYGEHWARPWLDLARYADSNGYQADQLRESWAYRDWVINALNQGMPFDEFVIEQLAGDLLPNATIQQRIATGFHRTVTCNVEAGVHPEENRTNQIFDRVNTTGTVFLGTTLECSQCHNHKYDPFSQHDYYQLFAYFNNTPLEVKQSGGVTYDFVGPKMSLPLPEAKREQRARLQAQYDALVEKRKTATAASAEDRARWEEETVEALDSPPEWKVLPIAKFETNGGEDHELLEDHSVLVTGSIPGTSIYTLTVETDLQGIAGFKVETLTHPSLPGTGPGRGDDERSNFVLNEFSIAQVEGQKSQRLQLHSAQADFSQERWPVANCIDGDRKSGWAIAPQFHKPHWATFLLKKRLREGKKELTFTFDQNFGRGRTIGCIRLSALIGNPDVLDLPEPIAKILRKPADERNKKEQEKLVAHYDASNPVLKQLDVDIAEAKKRLDRIQPPTTLVMVEMDEPRKTNVLLRGNYLTPGEEVHPGTPQSLNPLDKSLPKNRLGLARWITSRDNPLLARVTVNRWWAEFFGQGIVATLEDFGTQCEPPTHPQLLDWLAVEFMENGWSMKKLHKQIVMSATFQQESKVDAAALERDPENKLYARGPRMRLSAEGIRDNALAACGLLSTKMGGPPVMPYQPGGIWRAVGRNAPKWAENKGEDRYRRGIYVVWRRAAPYPSMVNFDAPDRAACVVKRPRTNTPLQALTLLNDPAYAEMALALARRMMIERPDADTHARANYGFRLCVSRAPTEKELNVLLETYQHELARFRENPRLAESLVSGLNAIAIPKNLDQAEVAAWFYVANILLNLDETITNG